MIRLPVTLDRRTVIPLILGVAVLVGIAVAAATLNSPAGVSGGLCVEPPAESDPNSMAFDGTGGDSETTTCIPLLTEPLVVTAVVGGVVLAGGIGYRWTESVVLPAVFSAGLGVAIGIVYVRYACGPVFHVTGSSLGADVDPGVDPTIPFRSLLAGLVVLVIVGAIMFVVRSSRDDVPSVEEANERSIDTTSVGEAAGDAADRIENAADVSNEVYRAWHEMTDHLEVAGPESSTPHEFSTAAVDAGMDPDDVAMLTTLFEEIRYGNEPVTDDREQRALAALRRIEETYTEGES